MFWDYGSENVDFQKNGMFSFLFGAVFETCVLAMCKPIYLSGPMGKVLTPAHVLSIHKLDQ